MINVEYLASQVEALVYSLSVQEEFQNTLNINYQIKIHIIYFFLTLTWAQGVTLSVRLSLWHNGVKNTQSSFFKLRSD